MATYETLTQYLKQHGIQNFTGPEVARLRLPPERLWPRIVPTLLVWERLRARIQPGYISVSSGYRDPEHNRRVGGGTRSLHLTFNAIDATPMRGQNPLSLEECEGLILEDPLADFLGLGRYRSFIHIDTRGLFNLQASGARFELSR